MFETLFSPIRINQIEVKNRITFPAMGLLYSLDQSLNERYENFYVERAKGGAGIVTVGPVGIGELGVGLGAPAITSDASLDDFSRLVRKIHEAGAKAWIQLYHGGAYVRPIQINNQQPISASAYYSKWSGSTTREMTLTDIKNVQNAFVDCAIRAKEAGFDGVEIIASAGYLICQFLSPLRNHRDDEYGGSFANRIRFVREIIEQMRSTLGAYYPITIRMAGNNFVPNSDPLDEILEYARTYERSGIDAISVTGGWHESNVPQLTSELPRGGLAYLTQRIKSVVSIPIMASNRITDPWLAERLLNEGSADMVNLARVLLADPYWPQKAACGQSQIIRPCIACLQGCMDELFNIRPVICTVNPVTGYEEERQIPVTDEPKNIMVVGAGPGGMEAALRAAEAGHRVDLYEQAHRLGGQLWIAGTPPNKQELWELISYYQNALQHQRVNIHLNTKVDEALLDQVTPDFIIVAEGAEITVPAIEGINDASVISAWEVLAAPKYLGSRIAVIGGGAVGLEAAHFIASQGTITPEVLYFLFKHEAESIDRLRELVFKGNHEVTVFEVMPDIGRDVGKSTRWGLINNLKQQGVKIVTSARVLTIKDGRLTYEQGGQLISADFDQVVNACGARAVNHLQNALENRNVPYVVVGDAVRPARILEAIHEAYLAVMNHL